MVTKDNVASVTTGRAGLRGSGVTEEIGLMVAGSAEGVAMAARVVWRLGITLKGGGMDGRGGGGVLGRGVVCSV